MADLVKREARSLARRVSDDARGKRSEYLAFTLGDDIYAVPIGAVREILKLPLLAEVPRGPRDVLGIASVRGLLVTVVDLRGKLGLEPAEPTRKSRLLLVEGEDAELFGLLVDEVRKVYRLAEAEIEAASEVLAGQVGDHVAGIGRPEGEVVILMNLRPLLEDLGA